MARFGRWYPLADAGTSAPACPGVFQVRLAEGLLDYPTGKSAMVAYRAAPDVRAAVLALGAMHPGVPWLCRHLEEPPRDPRAALDDLLARFVNRFGAAPRLP